MYTRNYGKPNRGGTKYSPPPGYDGNAFSASPEVKLHEAESDVTRLPRRSREQPAPVPAADAEPETVFEENPIPEQEPESEEFSGEEQKPEPAERETKPAAEPESIPVFGYGMQALEALFHHLRGKFGREELIIVLVMLLVASDGASIELILLALILLAG